MTPEQVLALIREGISLGLASTQFLAFAKQRHPELRTEPLPELERTERARELARKRLGIDDDPTDDGTK